MGDSGKDQGPAFRHPFEPAVRFDGGDLDCGSGLLLQIRRRIDPLDRGQLLEIRSTEPSVAEDLPAWCRMTGNELVSTWHDPVERCWSFLVSKNQFNDPGAVSIALREPSTRPLAEAFSAASPAALGPPAPSGRRA